MILSSDQQNITIPAQNPDTRVYELAFLTALLSAVILVMILFSVLEFAVSRSNPQSEEGNSTYPTHTAYYS